MTEPGPNATDPLAQVVALLQPDVSHSKLIEAAGTWRVRRSESGRLFYCAVLEGAARFSAEGHATATLKTGDFILIPAAWDFEMSSLDFPPGSRATDMPTEVRPYVFRLGDPDLPADVRAMVGYCEFGSPDAALLVSLLPRFVHVRDERRLATLVQLVDEEAHAVRPARAIILARLIEVLLIEALRSAGPAAPSGLLRGLGDERVAVALRLIHERPTAPWTVPDLAEAAALSRSAFFDRFRAAMGVAPMEYLLHWRMVLAKDLLLRRAGSIAEIAARVGYASASTFSVAFARHVGVAPSLFARSPVAE